MRIGDMYNVYLLFLLKELSNYVFVYTRKVKQQYYTLHFNDVTTTLPMNLARP